MCDLELLPCSPLPEMRWKKSNTTHFPHERVDYEHYGKTLVIHYVDFEDEGNYECEASNGVGVAKSYSMNVEVQGMFIGCKVYLKNFQNAKLISGLIRS